VHQVGNQYIVRYIRFGRHCNVAHCR